MRTSFGILWTISMILSCGEPTGPGIQEGTRTEGTATRNLGIDCFYGITSGGQRVPLSKIVHELRATDRGDVVDVAVIFNREFVDNTYGVNAIGWERHLFKDLTGSDHVELALINGAGEESFRAKIDYLTASDDAVSGFRSLGVDGGDGKMVAGELDEVVSFGSSLEDNFNRYGYVLIEDSPATDSSYTPNPQFPEWNFWVEYRISVLTRAFGASRFAHPTMEFVHASPSKFGTNTVEVEEGACPDDNSPTPFPECERTSPESECYDPEANGGSPVVSEGADSDGDGLPDLVDSDDDNDGTPDELDPDRNGNGAVEDSDGDGTPNASDLDDDDDGILDEIDGDDDGDGVPDGYDPDAIPSSGGLDPATVDSDADGMPDVVDNDDDGDGILDPIDLDRNGDGVPDDADGDGMPNVTDLDDDNDGLLDEIDGDDDGDGVPDEIDPNAVPDPVGGSECVSDAECVGGACVGGFCLDV